MKLKTSEVFRRVRSHLCDGEYKHTHKRYICSALHYLYLVGAIGDVDRTRCRRYILKHREGHVSLEAWLYDNHDIRFEHTLAYNKKIMATRKAWLTHLIEHYEAKGD